MCEFLSTECVRAKKRNELSKTERVDQVDKSMIQFRVRGGKWEIPVVGYCSRIMMNGVKRFFLFSQTLCRRFIKFRLSLPLPAIVSEKRERKAVRLSITLFSSRSNQPAFKRSPLWLNFFLPHPRFTIYDFALRLILSCCYVLPKGKREFIKSRDFHQKHFVFIEKCFMLFSPRPLAGALCQHGWEHMLQKYKLVPIYHDLKLS